MNACACYSSVGRPLSSEPTVRPFDQDSGALEYQCDHDARPWLRQAAMCHVVDM